MRKKKNCALARMSSWVSVWTCISTVMPTQPFRSKADPPSKTDLIDVKTLIEIDTWIISVGYGPDFDSNCSANFCQGRSSVLPEFVRKFVTLAWRCHRKHWLRPVIKRLMIFSVTPAPCSIPILVRLRSRSDKGWKRKLSHKQAAA